MDKDMIDALLADGEMLRSLTGEDHGPYFFDAAMAPRENPKHPMFRDHNCAYCGSGEKPCKQGNPSRCENLHARND